MSDILSQLWHLQQLDNDLALLNKKEAEIPKKIEGLQLACAEKREKLEALRKEVLTRKKEYKGQEIDLKECEGKIAQYSVQLYSVKNNEQYKAFLKEIEIQKKLKEELEEKMLVTLEMIENKEKEIANFVREVEEMEELTQRKIHSLEKEAAEIRKLRLAKEKERGEVFGSIEPESRAIYERIRLKKDGVAVAEILNERCSSCFNPIPAQTIILVGRRERFYYCDYCGRILYIKGK